MTQWPLWRDASGAERWIVSRVPMGSDVATVRQFIRRRGWKLDGEWQQAEPKTDFGTRKGTHVVYVNLGGYWFVFRTDFDAFFGFDERGRLVDVQVRKMVDTP